jgi:hypothetical protein
LELFEQNCDRKERRRRILFKILVKKMNFPNISGAGGFKPIKPYAEYAHGSEKESKNPLNLKQ